MRTWTLGEGGQELAPFTTFSRMQSNPQHHLPSTLQAVDIVHPWTLGEGGQELVPFTTFSVAMIHRQSQGQLPLFVEGIEAYKRLKVGWDGGGFEGWEGVLCMRVCVSASA